MPEHHRTPLNATVLAGIHGVLLPKARHTQQKLKLRIIPLSVCLLLAMPGTMSAQIVDIPLKNPSFEQGTDQAGLPVGWTRYSGNGDGLRVSVIEAGPDNAKALFIEDDDPGSEVGVTQTVPLKGGLVYEASVSVRGVEKTAPWGAYLQLRFLPSHKYVQTALGTDETDAFDQISIRGVAPPGTEKGTIYLYTHKGPTPKIVVDSVRLVSGVTPPPPPPPMPST